jgi:hypothetical protein
MRAFLFLVVMITAGIALISLGIKTDHMNARFDGAVVRVQGTVDEWIDAKNGDSSKSSYLPRSVSYHYEAADGRHDSTDNISSKTWDIVHATGALPLKYLQGDPSVCRIDLPDQDAGYRAEVWIDDLGGFSLLALGCIGYWKARHA